MSVGEISEILEEEHVTSSLLPFPKYQLMMSGCFREGVQNFQLGRYSDFSIGKWPLH